MTWSLEVRAAVVLTLIVALGAGALSWSALTAFAAAARIVPQLAWIYPLVVDGLMAVGSVAAFVLRAAPLRRRVYVWVLIGSAITVSVAGNAVHASGAQLPPLAAAAASAVPAAALAAALHLLVMIVRDAGARAPVKSTRGGAVPSRRRAPHRSGGRGARPVPTRDRVRVLVEEARAEGTQLTGDEIAQAVGVHPGHARRLLAQVAAGA